MIRRPPRSTRTDTLFPYTTLFRSLQALGLGGFLGVVGAGLFDRFGLGAFDEARVAEPSGKRVALLFRRGEPLGYPRSFGVHIDHPCPRPDTGDRKSVLVGKRGSDSLSLRGSLALQKTKTKST